VFVSLPGFNGCESLLEGETDRVARGERWGGGQADELNGLGPPTTWLLEKFVKLFKK
jgi:hypothetical protein